LVAAGNAGAQRLSEPAGVEVNGADFAPSVIDCACVAF
jgi:hypothetical protein